MKQLGTLALLGILLSQGAAMAGMLYVADAGSGIVAVDSITGTQRLVASGGYLSSPFDVALEANGNLLVADRGTRALVQVNATTGQQTLISSGQYFADPRALANGPNGTFYVADAGAFGGSSGKIIQVNPVTGTQTLISTGGYFEGVRDVIVQPNGNLLVGDRGYQAGSQFADGQLIVVNPTTGAQTLFASGGLLRNPDHLAIASNGDIIVADHDGLDGTGDVLRVNPQTGAQSVITTDGYFQGGPSGIALDALGNIFVSSNPREIVRVDPITGMQTLLSENGLLQSPQDVVYVGAVPEPASFILFGIGLAGIAGWACGRQRKAPASISA